MRRLSLSSPWWRRVWPTRDQPIRFGVLAGLGMGLLFWGLSAGEVSVTRDSPVEQATVVAVDEHRSLLGCGRGGGPELDVTYRSADPPAGLPAEFTHVGSCTGDFEVGDSVDVVRVEHGDGHVDVHPEPIRSYRQAAADGAAGLTIGFVLFGGSLFLRLLVLKGWTAWSRSRDREPDIGS